MEYVCFIVLRSCFIDPFIWSCSTKGFDIVEQRAVNLVITMIYYQDLVYMWPYQFLAFSLLLLFLPSYFKTFPQLFQEMDSQCWPALLLLQLLLREVTIPGVSSLVISLPVFNFSLVLCQEDNFYLCSFLLKIYFKTPLFSTEIFPCGLAYNPFTHG